MHNTHQNTSGFLQTKKIAKIWKKVRGEIKSAAKDVII